MTETGVLGMEQETLGTVSIVSTGIFYFIVLIAITLIQGYFTHRMAKKAGMDGGIICFIPFFQYIVLFKMVGMSRISLLLLFIPFLNIFIVLKLFYRIGEVYGINGIITLLITIFIPAGYLFMTGYFALSNSVEYVDIYSDVDEES